MGYKATRRTTLQERAAALDQEEQEEDWFHDRTDDLSRLERARSNVLWAQKSLARAQESLAEAKAHLQRLIPAPIRMRW